MQIHLCVSCWSLKMRLQTTSWWSFDGMILIVSHFLEFIKICTITKWNDAKIWHHTFPIQILPTSSFPSLSNTKSNLYILAKLLWQRGQTAYLNHTRRKSANSNHRDKKRVTKANGRLTEDKSNYAKHQFQTHIKMPEKLRQKTMKYWYLPTIIPQL